LSGLALLCQKRVRTGAPGYLISQFFSPALNQRDDAWGGGREARARFLLLVLAEIRRIAGEDFPVLWKMNCDDFLPQGAGQEEYSWLAGRLARAGANLIEISGGSRTRSSCTPVSSGRPVRARPTSCPPWRPSVEKVGRLPLALTGGLRSRPAMEKALASGADLVGLCRPLISEPNLPRRLLTEKGGPPARCIDCNQCLLAIAQRPLACVNFS
jgi:2,4-dienoyl-CoA reductase-like NADH-dependent reductase (Old Yellow Enzyme family)